MGDLRRHRGFAGPCGAADEEDDRQVELAECLETAEKEHRLAVLVLGEDRRRDIVETLGADGLVLVPAHQLALDQPGELVGPLGTDAGAHERPGHEPLRVGEPHVLREERLERATVAVHASALALMTPSASALTASSRSGSPGSGRTSLSANTTGTPRVSAVSATTSMAAALISVT